LCEVNPRYTSELTIYGIPENSTSSFRNPTNIHNLHILSFLQENSPDLLDRPIANFEQIGGSIYRFTTSDVLDSDLRIDGMGFSSTPPPNIRSHHVNAGLFDSF